MRDNRFYILMMILVILMSACQPMAAEANLQDNGEPTSDPTQESILLDAVTNTRPVYQPGELVDYLAQSGDTLPAIASHFNTTVDEIRKVNEFIPEDVTTMPPGMPMKIPIYYAPFWGSPYQLLPDSSFVNGPADIGEDIKSIIDGSPGWLNGYKEFASGDTRSSSEIIEMIGLNYSVSPRLLLALIEYQAGGLSQPVIEGTAADYPLGNRTPRYRGLFLQLTWAANYLNNIYYDWRSGSLQTFELSDGKIVRPDPWQNACSVALQVYFSRLFSNGAYLTSIGPEGFVKTYQTLFGDPWNSYTPHLPGSLEQPTLLLPFKIGNTWAFTGGPHNAWGDGMPLSALDFAPGLKTGGCTPTEEWALAAADGVVARSELATVVLDLDGDGNERTGWVLFYFHLATEGRASLGMVLKTGDPIGHPSCEGGRATGTHVHIARKYNGEWIPAGGVLAFNLEGWVASYGSAPYLGTLTRFSQTKTACTCSDVYSQITAGK